MKAGKVVDSVLGGIVIELALAIVVAI